MVKKIAMNATNLTNGIRASIEEIVEAPVVGNAE
jgi:hypothetical protein